MKYLHYSPDLRFAICGKAHPHGAELVNSLWATDCPACLRRVRQLGGDNDPIPGL